MFAGICTHLVARIESDVHQNFVAHCCVVLILCMVIEQCVDVTALACEDGEEKLPGIIVADVNSRSQVLLLGEGCFPAGEVPSGALDVRQGPRLILSASFCLVF